MTWLAGSINVRDVEQATAMAARAAEAGADLVEYRLDEAPATGAGLSSLSELAGRSPLPCIVTCRPAWEGGRFAGDEQSRAAVLAAACGGSVKPAYVDVELKAWREGGPVRDAMAPLLGRGSGGEVDADTDMADGAEGSDGPGLILSTHDFERRPADLLSRIEAMAAEPRCRVIKAAWTARSLRDNLEAFELISHRYKPTIALCMGEFGLPSRVLAKKFGGFLTFASVDGVEATAPGQPTLSEMTGLYRWSKQTASTKVYGVIGWPVGHSMSPAIHNAGFDATGFDGVYLPMPIPPEYEHFKATVGGWIAAAGLDFGGASVTIPHKENLLRYVAEHGGEIEPLSASIGAANTLTLEADGRVSARNTDYAAALDAVCRAMRIERAELSGKRVAVLGAGGAARAIVAGLAGYGATVVIYNRTHERAAALAAEFSERAGAAGSSGDGLGGKVVAARWEKLCDACCEVFINCTPLGMSPKVDATPMPAEVMARMRKGEGVGVGQVVFDTIYNPPRTKLLNEAEGAGATIVQGTEMFVLQAAAQFETWAQTPAPLETFRKVLYTHIGA